MSTRGIHPSFLACPKPASVQHVNASVKHTVLPKTVAVIDYFNGKTIDIDGDKIPDLSHGETIVRLIKALAPQIKVKPYGIHLENDNKTPSNHSLTEALRQVLKSLRSGEQVDAVNLSLSHEGSRSVLEKLKNPSLRQTLMTTPFFNQSQLSKRLEILETLTYQGVQIYASAGNIHPDLYNCYGAAQDVRLIAHTNFEGTPLNHTNLRDPHIDDFAQGKYAISQLKEGFDLNGDNIVDIKNREVSGQGKSVSIVSPFNGKPVSKKLGSLQDIATLLQRGNDYLLQNNWISADWTPDIINNLYAHITQSPLATEKVYALKDLHQAGLLNKAGLTYFSTFGDYALYPAHQKEVIFKVDHQGKLQYNPDNSGQNNIVGFIQGSSYAAPTALAKDLG